MRRTLSAMATVLALVFGAGCGNEQVEADNAYVAAADRVVRTFETQFQQLQSSFTAVSTPEQDRQTLDRLRFAVNRAVAQLRRVQAPARIAPLHARLVAQVGEYLPAIADAERAIGIEDLRAGAVSASRRRFSGLLASIATKITATINRINDRLQ